MLKLVQMGREIKDAAIVFESNRPDNGNWELAKFPRMFDEKKKKNHSKILGTTSTL